MNGDRPPYDRLEQELSRVEYPGEDGAWIGSYLAERRFVDRVMRVVVSTRIRHSRATIWASVAALNIAILVVARTNPNLVEDVLTLRNELAAFFYWFLGVTLAGCVVGVVLSLASGPLESFFQHLQRELSVEKLRDLFRHPR